jgi:putative Holliday junction resolvase
LNRVLSVDYGIKRIGVALSDLMQIIAKPYTTIINIDNQQVLQELDIIVQDKNVNRIIVGLPLTLKGEYSEQTKITIKFVEFLKQNMQIEILTYDERLSSIQAKNSLIKQGVKTGHNKGAVDQTAAALFLQGYLDGISNK